MTKEFQQCPICSGLSWLTIDTLHSGIWDKEKTELTRIELDFPIGECEQCSHVQVNTIYNEFIFSCLYFSDVREPPMFFLPNVDEKQPYQQMFDFFKEYIPENSNIVDFGCGAGNTFKEIKEHKIATDSLTGIDFNPMVEDETIKTLIWDLNSLDSLTNELWPSGIDLAISTHVLEHVINPVSFLFNIANNLSDTGKIFIEVPDCSHDTDLSNIAMANAVHGQHIHYYTKNSLSKIADRAGLRIIKTQQIMTRVIPRILIILEKNSQTPSCNVIQNTAVSAIKYHFKQLATLQDSLAANIIAEIDKNGSAGIWGIGGDAYLLMKKNPKLIHLVKEKKLKLFDYELAGHRYQEQLIESSTNLSSVKFTVFMTPIYAVTRDNMKLVSQDWLSNIIDPYC